MEVSAGMYEYVSAWVYGSKCVSSCAGLTLGKRGVVCLEEEGLLYGDSCGEAGMVSWIVAKTILLLWLIGKSFLGGGEMAATFMHFIFDDGLRYFPALP